MSIAASDPRHGTANGYCNLGCRCDACREAWRTYEPAKRNREAYRRRKGHAPQAPARPIDELHGTNYAYVKRLCRCAQCRAAHAAYRRANRAANRAAS